MEEESLFVEQESVYTGDVSAYTGDVVNGESARSEAVDSNEPLVATDENELLPTDLTAPPMPPDYKDVTLSAPLAFQRAIIRQLLDEDGLLVVGRGLGMPLIAANLLHAIDVAGTRRDVQSGNKTDKENLVILIGARDDDIMQITEDLWQLAALSDSGSKPGFRRGLTVVNTDKVTLKRRTQMYQEGGVFSITSRILIVDMLSGTIDCSRITGVVVLHAHRVSENSTEAFILRFFRDKNSHGFIKALSDEPEAFSSGLSPLTTKLRILNLRKVFLWPRFHLEVTDSLVGSSGANVRALGGSGKGRNEVVEIKTFMSEAMVDMQRAIMECIEACLSQIKKTNAQLDTEHWNLDNSLNRDFVRMVRLQLDPIWHRIPWRTKQIVFDLGTLKQILNELTVLDAVSFYQTLEEILLANQPGPGSLQEQSPWLALDSAHTLFELARERVYGPRRAPGVAAAAKKAAEHPIEELPKWYHLASILDEITADKGASGGMDGPVLIMCDERRTARQLTNYLASMAGPDEGYSAQGYLRRKLNHYVEWKRVVPLMKAKLKVGAPAQDTSVQPDTGIQKVNPNKRRRVRGGSATAARGGRSVATGALVRPTTVSSGGASKVVYLPDTDDSSDVGMLTGDTAGGYVDLTGDDNDYNLASSGVVDLDAENSEGDAYENSGSMFEIVSNSNLVVLHNYDSRASASLLEELRPSYVVMYEPDPAFLRSLEVVRASHPDRPIKAYFMFYSESVEEQRYLAEIRREKDAFTKLIREKANMPVYLDTSEDQETTRNKLLRTVSTRIAGGGLRVSATDEPPRVVVDVREFRSSLPFLLYRQGIQVAPAMLTVGDYIVTPRLCVERKSIADLVSSFRDGRLFVQCETMFRYYESPALLVEFDESKSFSLETFSDTPGGATINTTNASAEVSSLIQENVQQKLAVLLLSFPKLKIIWSSSPHHTAEIFADLKSKQEEPDPEEAAEVGLSAQDGSAKLYNHSAIDMLRSIPGVTIRNYHLLINYVPNMEQLCAMPEEELTKVVGKEAARKIVNFITQNLRT